VRYFVKGTHTGDGSCGLTARKIRYGHVLCFIGGVEILPVDLSSGKAEDHQVSAEEVAEDDSSQMIHYIPTIQVSEVDTASANSGYSYKHSIDQPTSTEEPHLFLMHRLRNKRKLSWNTQSTISSASRRFGVRAKSAIPAVSLYDALIKLLQHFHSSGRTEILRLLIERQFMAPIFIPSMKNQVNKHFLSLFRFVKTQSDICPGTDSELLRVTVISSCSPSADADADRQVVDLKSTIFSSCPFWGCRAAVKIDSAERHVRRPFPHQCQPVHSRHQHAAHSGRKSSTLRLYPATGHGRSAWTNHQRLPVSQKRDNNIATLTVLLSERYHLCTAHRNEFKKMYFCTFAKMKTK